MTLVTLTAWVAAAGGVSAARAHGGEGAQHVHADPWLVLPLLLTMALYAAGFARMRGRRPWRRAAIFAAACAVLAGALTGPVERLAHASLAWHMAQHMILLTAAPLLLLLAEPLPAMLRALPRRARVRLARPIATLYRTAASAGLAAFAAHGAAIWLWHLPALYDAAAEHAWLHRLEHACFLFSALWFWLTLIAPSARRGPAFGAASLWAVLTVLHTGMLGALLTFAPAVLYAPPGAGSPFSPGDQQIAGLLMWVPGGIAYSAAGFVLWLRWLGIRTGDFDIRLPSGNR